MKKLALAVVAFVLVLVGQEAQACSYQMVANAMQGTWQVNNAGGQGYGGWFVTGDGYVVKEDKPQVSVYMDRDGYVHVGSSGALSIGNFRIENYGRDPWCGFDVGGYQGRIHTARNNWVIFEIGAHNDRNKVELIRR